MENLPNDIIMKIIRIADGGKYTHQQKFKSSLNIILNNDPVYFYEDGEGNKDCPMFLCEIFNQDDEEDDY